MLLVVPYQDYAQTDTELILLLPVNQTLLEVHSMNDVIINTRNVNISIIVPGIGLRPNRITCQIGNTCVGVIRYQNLSCDKVKFSFKKRREEKQKEKFIIKLNSALKNGFKVEFKSINNC